MIVVSDTTAITTLMKIGEAQLIREMYGNVIIPKAVWDELNVFHADIPEFISLRLVTVCHPLPALARSLGRGEVEAIQLAKETNAELLLTDDRQARRVASHLGIKCAGLLAIFLAAKARGRIASVRTAIERLEKQGGLYLSASVKAEALKLAGE